MQRAEKVQMRRDAMERLPDLPSTHEHLGDALREAGDVAGAIVEYDAALALTKPSGDTLVVSTGLETKRRLAALELDQEQHPERHGLTLRTRQSLCRTCGTVAGPDERDCPSCGAPMPVNTFLDTLQHNVIREDILRTLKETLAIVAVVVVAVCFMSFLSIEVRCCLVIAAIIVVPLRLLKSITDV